MLAMRFPPDFSKLAQLARSVPGDRPWLPRLGRRTLQTEELSAAGVAFDRRRLPRRRVDAPVYLGVIPPLCEKLRLSRIPVSVFKPLDGGWATDLSTQGLSLLCDKPVEVGGRHWLRLDHIASRPTILPGRVVSCEPAGTTETAPAAQAETNPAPPSQAPAAQAFRVRVAFLMHEAGIPERLGFVEDPITAVA